MFPINPKAEEVEGDKCYPNLQAIPDGVDGVVIATHPKVTEEIVVDSIVDEKIIFLSEGEGSDLVNKYKLGYTLKDNDFNGLNNLISHIANQRIAPFKSSELQKTSKEVFDFNIQFNKLLERTNSI